MKHWITGVRVVALLLIGIALTTRTDDGAGYTLHDSVTPTHKG